MKILRVEHLIAKGPFAVSAEFKEIQDEIVASIATVRWPIGSHNFTVRPEKKGNGVPLIKTSCMEYLSDKGWQLEARMKIMAASKPGPIDANRVTTAGLPFVLEWETGNISSSHRAMNKISVGLLEGCVIGGCLILPSRKFYTYLTDRIGNYQELEPYFPLWRSLDCHITNGVLFVVEIEHDAVSEDVPRIPKGTDGRALR